MKYIVTHPGKAHRDDVLAIALFLGYFEEDLSIQRKTPTQSELEDPGIIVIDVGGQHDPSKMNFDHHQFAGDKKARCALSLVLNYLQMDKEAYKIWKWLEPTEIYDAKGPNYFNNYYKINSTIASRLYSPIEEGVLKIVGSKSMIASSDDIYQLLKSIGVNLYKQLSSIHNRIKDLKDKSKVYDIDFVKVLDTRPAIGPEDDITFGVNTFCKDHHPDVDIIISHDDRDDGVALYRRRNEERINFMNIDNLPEVYFAHQNGFLAKVKAGTDLLPLIQKSICYEPEDKKQNSISTADTA